ncbi:MAG: uroporphyrinogen decarboxylase, partial [Candidatus Dormibacteria bacterium]
YRELRERYDILTITRTPELCTRVTLMPVAELGVDAAVMYADIMLPLYGMGVPFIIDPGVGPVIQAPVRDSADIDRLRIVDAHEATPDLFEAIRLVRAELGGRAAVLGFAGAPFTVASYLIEGRPSRDFARAKGLMLGRPDQWHRLMETLTEVTIRYLKAQVEAGAQALQLFDSWAGALSSRDYVDSVLPYTRRIFQALQGTGVPSIHFATNTTHLLEAMASAGSDVVSVDWRSSIGEAWSRIGDVQGIQGNLDPVAACAPFAVAAGQARRILAEAGGRPGHIFNLGHGVLPDTPPENLARLVELVHAVNGAAAAPAGSSPA